MPRQQQEMSQITCCAFDLETTHLNADFGVLLCAVIKPAYGEPIIFRADKLNKRWRTNRSNDHAIVKATVDELANWDIWIAHNGAKFDVPWLRTRLAKHSLPPLPNKKLLDPLQLARNKLRMSYNSLDKLATFLGVNSKTEVDPDQWLRASLDGDSEAMDYVTEHCVEDVLTLEKIVGVLKNYSSNLNSYGSGF